MQMNQQYAEGARMEREVQAPNIYDNLRNTMGNRMCTEFLNFLSK
jgi:hypothetical protein